MPATPQHTSLQIVAEVGRNLSVSERLVLHLYLHQFAALTEKLLQQFQSQAQSSASAVSRDASMRQPF
jgi:hypothetical protein